MLLKAVGLPRPPMPFTACQTVRLDRMKYPVGAKRETTAGAFANDKATERVHEVSPNPDCSQGS